ncbi:hypothetical protein TanjilG_06813 [Lupinus angustifolius]|uniref:Uncharacterized protein n=1 Tax=Lupinus angustifolius TaxID=3871 RepID=A0A1J7G5P8_LUPAN|nr:PREDICTED: uncharacterized protein LOC109329555 [Lupinus angustifolius]OIV95837.1 hypothetical protein TanjilG_06813 [Lupinus angustifolius]
MGNCSTIPLPMEWACEDWGSETSEHEVFDDDEVDHGLKNVEKERLLGSLRASSDANGKVKVMISKKELEEFLLQKHDIGAGNASAEQVLVRLINAKYVVNHHRPWTPVLHSIPEVN